MDFNSWPEKALRAFIADKAYAAIDDEQIEEFIRDAEEALADK